MSDKEPTYHSPTDEKMSDKEQVAIMLTPEELHVVVTALALLQGKMLPPQDQNYRPAQQLEGNLKPILLSTNFPAQTKERSW